ncbi:hypothetical protein [Leuconostoc lactis]|uniref:hypothetical protein n=1 Tax=Leuconostoc lactis TaxID=1246 RepID=UPI00101ED731|nr:hypothetical protein [Leuconostoc lactis]MSB65629.1 hypothetical protein [Leuconostoc lactis]RYS84995.1 hypothetical protein EAI73_08145 [Leuconostoc lactis]
MKKSDTNTKFLWERKPISRVQQILAGTVASLPMWLPMTAFADIGDAAKTSGTKVITILYIVLIVVSAVSLVWAFILRSTGSERLAEKSNSKLMHALFGVFGGCLTGLIIAWIYQTATSAGGGNVINWPF